MVSLGVAKCYNTRYQASWSHHAPRFLRARVFCVIRAIKNWYVGPCWFWKLCYSKTTRQDIYYTCYILHGIWYRKHVAVTFAGALTNSPFRLRCGSIAVLRGNRRLESRIVLSHTHGHMLFVTAEDWVAHYAFAWRVPIAVGFLRCSVIVDFAVGCSSSVSCVLLFVVGCSCFLSVRRRIFATQAPRVRVHQCGRVSLFFVSVHLLPVWIPLQISPLLELQSYLLDSYSLLFSFSHRPYSAVHLPSFCTCVREGLPFAFRNVFARLLFGGILLLQAFYF